LEIILATTNPGKLREMQETLSGFRFRFRTLEEFEATSECEETGATFRQNARIKASHYFQQTGLPALADDSGLEVDALGGAPGVRSSRYGSDDANRIQRLLKELTGVPEAARTARFVCALCLKLNDRKWIEATGIVQGRIDQKPRGERGFGYDPVFFYPPLNQTFGEMESALKNKISHRAKALRALRRQLKRELG
jgi:XTP/dITP diphosphohydrolase